MSVVWCDLVARARGLSTHLLGGPRLRALCSAPDLDALYSQLTHLSSHPLPSVERREPSPAVLEGSARRTVAARLHVLARWSGPRTKLLAPIFDAEDHRSIRAALRGAVAGIAPAERREGLIATPALPERALDELAAQPTAAAVAALLAAWQHPFAAAILAEARREQPDLYVLESALDTAFADRAARTARRNDPALRAFVAITLLTDRTYTALLADDPAKALAALRGELPRSPLGRLIARGALTIKELDQASLETLLSAERAHARRDPLALGPVLYFVARLRAEFHDLMRIAWGIALGVPRPQLVSGVISP